MISTRVQVKPKRFGKLAMRKATLSLSDRQKAMDRVKAKHLKRKAIANQQHAENTNQSFKPKIGPNKYVKLRDETPHGEPVHILAEKKAAVNPEKNRMIDRARSNWR